MTLDFENVTFQYPTDSYRMFEDLSFHLEKGEFTALIGASGSGKSTIFRLINHFLIPESGSIRIDGQEVGSGKAECGYMPQHDLLFPWRTVEANVMLPMEIKKQPKSERKAAADALLSRVGLAGSEKKRPGELSGGMRQRAAFARTLATGADLLLLDEPFSALDSITRISMQEWLVEQWENWNKTILFVTHDVEEAIFLSKRILVLTGRPAKSLIDIEVPLPKARTRDMLLRPEIMELKNRLIEMLQEEAAKNAADDVRRSTGEGAENDDQAMIQDPSEAAPHQNGDAAGEGRADRKDRKRRKRT